MDVSIIIPVFNKSGLTRVCLNALRRTLPTKMDWEVVVIDNASTDDTQIVLAEFPWIRMVRNLANLGFAGANNQGAAIASGTLLILLNNDTEPQAGWVQALVQAAQGENVGVVGARLLFPDRTVQHAGVVFSRERFGPFQYNPYHYLWSSPGTALAVMQPREYQAVTGACLATPRDLYLELGGLDEAYWNGYEDIDYCFKVTRSGKRIVYEPQAEIIHFESQSGIMRFSRQTYNAVLLASRWPDYPKTDHTQNYLRAGNIRRKNRYANLFSTVSTPTPKTTVLVHGSGLANLERLAKDIQNTAAPLEKIIWTLPSDPPSFGRIPVLIDRRDCVEASRTAMDIRGDRYLAFVEATIALEPLWLDRLIEELEFGTDVVAATIPPDDSVRGDTTVLSADARCTLLALRFLPQHEALRDFPTLGGAVADLLLRMLPYEYGTRVALESVKQVPVPQPDEHFSKLYGAPLSRFLSPDLHLLESVLRERPTPDVVAKKASIIMLSWNAPEFTKIALESIRAHTKMEHEVIIVDNGSSSATTDWLKELENVTVIYNATNRGFAAGCNQGIAAATGDYIVLLNNDVAVTDGWLENLVLAVMRDPATGVSAPRSNEIAGDQKLLDLDYSDLEQMQGTAARRSRVWRRAGYFTDRAIGFCLCIDRTVIEQVGGIDEAYGTGNFEDDDFCMRVRAAGYRIFVCDDVFIHHFGSKSFQANNVDYAATMSRNWAKFAAKWGYPAQYPLNGYDPQRAIRHGFDRMKHFISIGARPQATAQCDLSKADSETNLLIAAIITSEDDWSAISSIVRRCLNTFTIDDSVAILLGCQGEASAESIGKRVEKMIEKGDIDPARCVDVFVSDEGDLLGWIAQFKARNRYAMPVSRHWLPQFVELGARSPSDLRRLYEGLGKQEPRPV
ncbi:MAG: hypothetical protein NVSMB31_08040 [Vulcanimicrobiaceae bacterium]